MEAAAHLYLQYPPFARRLALVWTAKRLWQMGDSVVMLELNRSCATGYCHKLCVYDAALVLRNRRIGGKNLFPLKRFFP